MSAPKPAPLLLDLGDDVPGKSRLIYRRDGLGGIQDIVAEVFLGSDAEAIVRACNAHEGLVMWLGMAYSELRKAEIHRTLPTMTTADVEEIAAALAKAKEDA